MPGDSFSPVPNVRHAPGAFSATVKDAHGDGSCGPETLQAKPGESGPRKSVQNRAGEEALSRPPLRAVFMGTPEFAATILHHLLACPHVDITAVYCQPDRPAGRGRVLKIPAVKELAAERGIPVHQPLNFRTTPEGDAAFDRLAGHTPDVLLVAAYGLVLPRRVLDIPRLMPINVHASLLPRYRGAAPIQRSIMNGDAVTGITIMRMEAGLDTGPILMQRAVGIDLNDTSATLHDELSREGAELLTLALERLSAGMLQAIPQEESRATHAAKLSKEESLLDFSLSCRALHAHIRGVTPWPGASMILHRDNEEPLTVLAGPGIFPLPSSLAQAAAESSCARAGENARTGVSVARIAGVADNALLVTCGDGCYAFTRLRPSGKKAMDGRAFFNGYLSGSRNAHFSGREQPSTI